MSDSMNSDVKICNLGDDLCMALGEGRIVCEGEAVEGAPDCGEFAELVPAESSYEEGSDAGWYAGIVATALALVGGVVWKARSMFNGNAAVDMSRPMEDPRTTRESHPHLRAVSSFARSTGEFANALLMDPDVAEERALEKAKRRFVDTLLTDPYTGSRMTPVDNWARHPVTGQLHMIDPRVDLAELVEQNWDVEIRGKPGKEVRAEGEMERLVNVGDIIMTKGEQLDLMSEAVRQELEAKKGGGGGGGDGPKARNPFPDGIRKALITSGELSLGETEISSIAREIAARHGKGFLRMDVEDKSVAIEHAVRDYFNRESTMPSGTLHWEIMAEGALGVTRSEGYRGFRAAEMKSLTLSDFMRPANEVLRGAPRLPKEVVEYLTRYERNAEGHRIDVIKSHGDGAPRNKVDMAVERGRRRFIEAEQRAAEARERATARARTRSKI